MRWSLLKLLIWRLPSPFSSSLETEKSHLHWRQQGMLFILTSLTNFPSTPAKYCCLFVLFASTVELTTWECRDREATEGPDTAGQIKPEVLWSHIFKQNTLDTMTPPCAIKYFLHMQQYVQPSQAWHRLAQSGADCSPAWKNQNLLQNTLDSVFKHAASVHVTTF